MHSYSIFNPHRTPLYLQMSTIVPLWLYAASKHQTHFVPCNSTTLIYICNQITKSINTLWTTYQATPSTTKSLTE